MLFNERQDSVEAQYTGAVLEGYGQRALLLKIYGHLPDRNLKVYTLKACKAIGLHYIEFWRLGTILQGVLQGTLPSPCGERLPPVRRLIGSHGSFSTSDHLLLFCLYYLVAGHSQKELGKLYERKDVQNMQGLVSSWWRKAEPFFRAALEHCCTSSDDTTQKLARRLRNLALANHAKKEPPKRGRRFPSIDLVAIVDAKLPRARVKSDPTPRSGKSPAPGS